MTVTNRKRLSWKRLKCLLTGGHEYLAMNLNCKIYERLVVFCNTCCKCGHVKAWSVPKRAIFPDQLDGGEGQ